MKFITLSVAAFAAHVSGHATFQAIWVNGSSCLRIPQSNSPVQNVLSNDIRCNANNGPATLKCPVAAGSIVTFEMHQQPNDRSCAQEGIGGQHYGPVIVYMSKVADAITADGSAGWFKIFQNGWAKVPNSPRGDDDSWGVKDLNTCCGRMSVKIPTDIPNGDYLIRPEVIALHSAGQAGGAQFYLSCFQITVTNGGTATPSLVNLPGAYAATDPGIKCDIHPKLNSYIIPGPTVYAGGSTRVPGSGTCSGVESGTAPGPALPTSPATTASVAVPTTTLITTARVSTSMGGTTARTSTSAATTTSVSGGSGCVTAKFGQCGGQGFTGCTICASGSKCSAVSPPFYSQCI